VGGGLGLSAWRVMGLSGCQAEPLCGGLSGSTKDFLSNRLMIRVLKCIVLCSGLNMSQIRRARAPADTSKCFDIETPRRRGNSNDC